MGDRPLGLIMNEEEQRRSLSSGLAMRVVYCMPDGYPCKSGQDVPLTQREVRRV